MTIFWVRDNVHPPWGSVQTTRMIRGSIWKHWVLFLAEETSDHLGQASTEHLFITDSDLVPNPTARTCHTPCRGRWWWGLSRRWWCCERGSSSLSSTHSGHCLASASQRGWPPGLWSPGWCHHGCGRGHSVPVGSWTPGEEREWHDIYSPEKEIRVISYSMVKHVILETVFNDGVQGFYASKLWTWARKGQGQILPPLTLPAPIKKTAPLLQLEDKKHCGRVWRTKLPSSSQGPGGWDPASVS